MKITSPAWPERRGNGLGRTSGLTLASTNHTLDQAKLKHTARAPPTPGASEVTGAMGQERLPPLAKGLPLIGNLFDLLGDPLGFMTRAVREHGDVVRIRVGPLRELYVLGHPDAIEHVLRTNHRDFIKDKMTRNQLGAVLGQGLLTSEGEFWRRQRRLAQPAFQLDQIQRYSTVMVDYAGRMVQGWQSGETRNAHADMMRLTLEIVAQVLFTASVGDKAARVGHALEALTDYWAGPGGFFTWWKYLPVPGAVRYRQAVRDIDAIILETIAGRRAGDAGPEDLLSRFLDARDEDGSRMSDRQLRDEMVTLLLAGHETTAVALSFCFYLLALHPEADAKLAAELDEVLGGGPPTAGHIARLRYTEWVVKEAMRLFPPVPSVGREALADCEIGGYRIPQGAQIIPAQWVVHRDRRWFGEDAEEFRPERWDNDLAKRIPHCAYFPFADGPRVCIGNHFAMMEAVLVLATVASRYRLELAPDYVLKVLPSVTLRPKGGIRMTVHQRTGRRGGSDAVGALGDHATVT
jgi:cytochrome P450